jgi:hypothetical protein
MSRSLLLVLVSLLLACSVPAAARPAPLVQVDIVDRDSGQWLPQYPHRHDTWVAGRPGHRYAVRLTNTSGRRVLVVLSVDGVNAVTGQTADPAQAGYVLGPWESTEISGWRKSLNDVAQFVFTDLGDSYAARTGRPDNVGVVGVAVFEEAGHYRPLPAPPLARGETRQNRAMAPAAESAASDSVTQQRIGTGHGQREWAPVGRTDFIRASRHPAQITQLRYDDARRLVAAGIIPRRALSPRHPQAFPGGFVADPPGYR